MNIDKDNYKINYRESYIFTNPIENEDDVNFKLRQESLIDQLEYNSEQKLLKNENIDIGIQSEMLTSLRSTANFQQKYLLDFIQTYFDHLLKYYRRPTHVAQPKPFHIVVNGLAGSGKSYAITIIEKMLNEFCIAESATLSHPRKNFGLLKMAHTGKAALNIHGFTIHSALDIV